MDIKVDGWVLTFHGDESVGIFSGSWTIEPEMYFEDEMDLEMFRSKLRDAFSLVCDESCLDIETFEEAKNRVVDEDKMWAGAEELWPDDPESQNKEMDGRLFENM